MGAVTRITFLPEFKSTASTNQNLRIFESITVYAVLPGWWSTIQTDEN